MSRQPFPTVVRFDHDPDWAPLEALARACCADDALSSFHPGEFMHMGCVESQHSPLTIHLYKHRDTRRYLNLDGAGLAYRYVGGAVADEGDVISGGRYRAHRTIDEALEHLQLWMFDDPTGLPRSFPPSEWSEEGQVP